MEATQLAALKLAPLVSQANVSAVFSPLSLIHALAILYHLSNGSVPGQLNSVFNISQYDSKKLQYYELSIAANIFLRNLTLKPEFREKILALFQCFPDKLVSAKQVNAWVAQHTGDKIKYLVDTIEGIDAILLSAVYFNQKFSMPFNENLTKQKQFNTFNGVKNAAMMRHNNKRLQYAKTSSAQIVDLKYENYVTARIILPLNNGFDAFYKALSEDNLYATAFSHNVNLELPRFKVESKYSLKSHLEYLECQDMFQRVDCTDSLGSFMAVDDVLYKAFIDVNEQGTEAAAATAIMMRLTSSGGMPKIANVICDRPFWFVLRKDNSVLFIVSYVG